MSQNNDSSTVIKNDTPVGLRNGKKHTGWHYWLLKKLYEGTGRPPLRIVLWTGQEVSHPNPQYEMHIRNKSSMYKVLLHPELYFGEAYMNGDIEIKGDLVGLLESIYLGRGQYANTAAIRKMLNRFLSPTRRNSLSGSRRNIHHHYDLSNPFYELWLDREAMQYTCGYFPRADYTLEQAQVAKLEHVCRKLQLKAGDTVVEAGCGWGGLARYMARQYGVKVRAYNISHEQVTYARGKARDMGLDHLVEFIEDDYRNIEGECDVFVSVGMLEHVGIENYKTLGEVIDRTLKPDGRGLVHSIGRNKPGKMNPWIEKRIFPGAQTPSLKQMMDIFEDRFSVLDVENLRLHYAETLSHWLERFEANTDKVRDMFDEEFVRTWRLYLAGSIAAFTSSQLQLFQVVFSRALNNEIPWSREHLYKDF